MCIMEVRRGQLDSTIAQACAHNLFTVVGDLAMFRELLAARARTEGPEMAAARIAQLDQVEKDLLATYDEALSLYGHFVADEVARSHEHGHDHDVDHDHPHHDMGDPVAAALEYNAAERTAEDIARTDETRARRYETR